MWPAITFIYPIQFHSYPSRPFNPTTSSQITPDARMLHSKAALCIVQKGGGTGVCSGDMLWILLGPGGAYLGRPDEDSTTRLSASRQTRLRSRSNCLFQKGF